MRPRASNPDISYAGLVCNGIDLDSCPYRSEKEDFLAFLGRSSPEKGPELAVDIAKKAGDASEAPGQDRGAARA